MAYFDLDQARRRAKELLRAERAGDGEALSRMRADRAPRLADAQRAVAADLGLASWPALVAHVQASSGDLDERRARLVHAALSGRDDIAEQLLEHDPTLARAGLDVALVLGDEPAVAAALDRDPSLVGRDLPGAERKPLSCACHSVFLRPSSPRASSVRRVIALLLEEAGARTGVVRVTELSYIPGRPVRVSVRRRGHRYDIDMGTAVAIAGRPSGWREAAERAVQKVGWNINRSGVVFIQTVEGRDLDVLVRRTA